MGLGVSWTLLSYKSNVSPYKNCLGFYVKSKYGVVRLDSWSGVRNIYSSEGANLEFIIQGLKNNIFCCGWGA